MCQALLNTFHARAFRFNVSSIIEVSVIIPILETESKLTVSESTQQV